MERPGLRECLPSAGEVARFVTAVSVGMAVVWVISHVTESPGDDAYWVYAVWACLCFVAACLAGMGALNRDWGMMVLAVLCGAVALPAYAVMRVLAA